MAPEVVANPFDLPAAALTEVERLLHDLAQPLTLLQCRLELARMDTADTATMQETLDGALEDSSRLFDGIKQLRIRLLGERPYGEG